MSKYAAPADAYQTFMECLTLDPDSLTEAQIRAMIACAGMLADDERFRFRHVLVRENLTDEEIANWANLQLLDRYFPPAASVPA